MLTHPHQESWREIREERRRDQGAANRKHWRNALVVIISCSVAALMALLF